MNILSRTLVLNPCARGSGVCGKIDVFSSAI